MKAREDLVWSTGRDIESSLARQFVEGEVWPIECASLAALIDLGVSDHKIADYFAVATGEVAALRRSCRLD